MKHQEPLTNEIIDRGLALLEKGTMETPEGWLAIHALCDLEQTIMREDLPEFYRAVTEAFRENAAE